MSNCADVEPFLRDAPISDQQRLKKHALINDEYRKL